MASNDILSTKEGSISISHYGDTANAPYGEKTPEQIATFSAQGINRAFKDGAEVVFIACNTASTQYEAIKKILNQTHPGRGERIVSIIDSSVQELKKQIDAKLKTQNNVQVAILATPATIKAGAYLRALATAYSATVIATPLTHHTQPRWYKQKGNEVVSAAAQATLQLAQGKTITISQVGPANWVDMIEHGASAAEKSQAIARDLALLAPKAQWEVVGEFCTHFPAIDGMIKIEATKLGLASPQTSYIKQGPLMATIFRDMMKPRFTGKPSKPARLIRAKIYISGTNLQETSQLAKEVFPQDPAPAIQQLSFQ